MITVNNISVCTTAIPRPDIHEITYSSFVKNIVGIDFKEIDLYLNIDPITGKNQNDFNQCIEVAKKYFKNVIFNVPEYCNFSNAVKWCWRSCNTDYIFHLEDDWELLAPINIARINKEFKNNGYYTQIVIRAWRTRPGGFSLSPSFIKREAYKTLAEILEPDQNPELQIRKLFSQNKNMHIKRIVNPNGSICAVPKDYNDVVLKDLGRNWMKSNKYIKIGQNHSKFTHHEIGISNEIISDQNLQINPKYLR